MKIDMHERLLFAIEPRSNPIFKKQNYTDKVYKSVIEKMNIATRRFGK
jgi:hypothetical protein